VVAFGGIAVVLVADSFRGGRPPHGLLLAPILFVAFFSVGIRLAVYSPTWGGGMDHAPVFQRGDQDGRAYRIPSLIQLPDGTLLAFAESRANAFLDWGDIDIVMRTSSDGGLTWGEIVTLVDVEDRTAGNACPVFDRDTSTLFLPYTIDNKNVRIISSVDGGRTWSIARDLTDEFGIGAEWNPRRFDYQYGTGPGVGIQLTGGRLVVPAYHFGGGAHVIYSDDHGETWAAGETAGPGGETQVAELPNGTLFLSSRNNSDGLRFVATSGDGGLTWNNWSTHEELPDQGCMAAIAASGGELYYSGPDRESRSRLAVRRSTDGGDSWQRIETVYTGPSAYSQLVSDGDSLLLLLEQGRIDYRESIQLVRLQVR
jgi:sialidase-1